MYRGSRLAAILLLFLTGTIVLSIGLLIAPGHVAPATTMLVIAFGVTHFVAIVGLARGRAWAGRLGLIVAEIGGGVAMVGIFAIVIGVPRLEAGVVTTDAPGLLAWMAGLYILTALSVGRVPGFTAPSFDLPNLSRPIGATA